MSDVRRTPIATRRRVPKGDFTDRPRRDADYPGLDARLADALSLLAERRGRSLPELLGKAPSVDVRPDLEGASPTVVEALAKAGYRDSESLSTVRLVDLGARAASFSAADLEELNTARVAASYTGSPLPPATVQKLAHEGVFPWDLAGMVQNACGDWVFPGDIVVPDDLRDRLQEWLDQLQILDLVDLGPWVRDPWGGLGPDDPRVDVGEIVPEDVVLPPEKLKQFDELTREAIRGGRVNAAVALADQLLAYGERDLAAELAREVAALDVADLDDVERFQAQTLAPAIVALASPDADEAIQQATRALPGLLPGSTTHRSVVRRVVDVAAERASSAQRRMDELDGDARAAAASVAKRAHVDVLTGRGAGDAAAMTGLAVGSAAVLNDLYGDLGSTLAAAMGTAGKGTPVARSASAVAFKLPPQAGSTAPPPTAVAQQTSMLTASTSAKLLSGSGTSALVDPFQKAIVLRSWTKLLDLGNPDLAFVPQLLPSDQFRFDWLLDEARTIAEDVFRLEQLLASFLHMVLEQALALADAAKPLLAELARLAETLKKAIASIGDQIRAIADQLVETVRSAATLFGIVQFLKRWPHENWVMLIERTIGYIGGGMAPIDALGRALDDLLTADLQAILDGVKAQIEQVLTDLTARLRAMATDADPTDSTSQVENMFGGELFRALEDTLGSSEAVTKLLQPVLDQLAQVDLLAAAQDKLNELNVAGGTPVWLRVLIAAYLVAPLAVAFGIASVGGPLAVVALKVLLALAAPYLVSLIVRALDDILGLTGDVTAQIDSVVSTMTRAVEGLIGTLTDLGAIKGLAAGISELASKITGQIPPEVKRAVVAALVQARDVVLDAVRGLLLTVERAFFRETLELVDVPAVPSPSALPAADGAQATLLGFADPKLGSYAQLASTLSAFETQRIAKSVGQPQLLTQVLSVRDLLPAGTADAALSALMAGGVLNLAISQVQLDRVAPGLHRSLVKDVALHVDFDLSKYPDPAKAVGLGTVDAGPALADAGAQAASVAGEPADPALSGAVPTGGFPGLAVAAGRIPTGLPVVLTHMGTSEVRLRPSGDLAAKYIGKCGKAKAPSELPNPIRGTRLLADRDADANAAGWRRLQLLDPPASMMFSHFDVLSDGIRFVHPDKHLKPFEHRGVVGSWKLEVPALALKSVIPDLPPIRDVRLVFSTVAHYDDALAHLLDQPAIPKRQPLPSTTSPVDDLVDRLAELLGGVRSDIEALAASITGGLAATLEDILDAVEGALVSSNAALMAVAADLEEALTSLEGTSGSLVDVADALARLLVLKVGALAGIQPSPGTTLMPLVLDTANPTGTGTSTASTVAPGSTHTFTVDAARLAAAGVTGTVQKVLRVTVTPVSTSSVTGTPVPLPVDPASLSLDGRSTPVVLSYDSTTVPPTSLAATGATALASPVGTWILTLPATLPAGALSRAIVGILVEVAP